MDSVAAFRRGRPKLFIAIVLAAAVTGTGLIAVEAADAGAPPPGSAVAASTDTPTPAPTATGMPGTSPFPPSAPTGLVATGVGAHSITLAWTASTPGCCSIVEYDVSFVQAFNDVVWSVPVGNVTTATLTANIAPASQYMLRVNAKDSAGHSSPTSNAVTVVTPASDSGPDTTPPQAPANLTATYTPSTSLSWSPSTDNVAVTGYNVYRFDGLYVSTLVATVTGTTYQPPFSAPTSSPSGLNSVFYVRARDAAGNVSIASNTVPVRPSTSPSPSPSPPVSPSPSPDPQACRVTYTTESQWTGGFVANVRIANSGSKPITGWRLAFSFGGDQRITSSWNVTFTQSGAAVTIRNVDWNAVIAARDSVSVGFQGTWTASDAPPTSFLLNGVGCVAG